MEGFEGDRQGSGCVGVIHIPRHAFLSTPRKHPSALTGCPWSTIVTQRIASEHGGSVGGPTPPRRPQMCCARVRWKWNDGPSAAPYRPGR
jgi:hypothetical protein